MAKEKPFHVYAEDGFESAHSTERAAVTAAKRGQQRRGVRYAVIACDQYGLTGGGRGAPVWPIDEQRSVGG